MIDPAHAIEKMMRGERLTPHETAATDRIAKCPLCGAETGDRCRTMTIPPSVAWTTHPARKRLSTAMIRERAAQQ